MKNNIDHHHAGRFGHVYRFIDILITMNDNKEFESSFKETYPAGLELKKENANDNVGTLLDLNFTVKKGQCSTKSYDKRDAFNFSRMRLSYKYSNLSQKFYSTISAEI